MSVGSFIGRPSTTVVRERFDDELAEGACIEFHFCVGFCCGVVASQYGSNMFICD